MLREARQVWMMTIGASKSQGAGIELFPRSVSALRAASAIHGGRWVGIGAVAPCDSAQPRHPAGCPQDVDRAAALTATCAAHAGASSECGCLRSSHMAVAHPSLGSTRLAALLQLPSSRAPRLDEPVLSTSARFPSPSSSSSSSFFSSSYSSLSSSLSSSLTSSPSSERPLCRTLTNGAASSSLMAAAAHMTLPSSANGTSHRPPTPVCAAPSTALQPAAPSATCRRRRRSCGSPRTGWRHVTREIGLNVFADAVSGSRGKVSTAATAKSEGQGSTLTREELVREGDPTNNVSDAIFTRLGMQLHNRPNHPLSILKNVIYSYFDERCPKMFNKFDNLSPIVSTKMNFDEVLVPADHVSRSYNDTYYIDQETVLRCHTSAHQAEMLRGGNTHFLVTGDVYRRDSIDATHYPVFHQMEGVRLFTRADWEAAGMDGIAMAEKDLKETLEGLAQRLFGSVEMRWVDTYFPFTDPSFELEIFFQGEWLEVLGCGVMEQQILVNCGRPDDKAWAFGLGLERLAMVLFDIPDIRLFWTDDERFTGQYPPCFKDISFWISDSFTENNLCEVVRAAAGDLAEEVKLIDEFTNKQGMTSHCYRIAYRSMDRSLTDEEINRIQEAVRKDVEGKLKVTLR
ncbi:hypothetical protein CBR_g19753 [Chara braunii]|uniref:phenylalanine--tRNA ligase n=1 Tax=Chara braunii TaxID=69332 RepID=A0A388JTW7_CHABU|nr:hypothetical protein CBR_g19753 [Chara braunii]|eukprot:GBG61220.1 hypothetical protein CBR_g19753 [Chara braunii]